MTAEPILSVPQPQFRLDPPPEEPRRRRLPFSPWHLFLMPLAAVMLRSASDEMRGRVMGMRMLAVWGLPLGLLIAGPVIQHFGYTATTVIYSTLGLAATFATAWRWRGALWSASAPANVHP